MTTVKLLQRAETVLHRLRTRLESLPDPDDAPTEKIRLEAMTDALNLRSLIGRVSSHAARVEKPKAAHDLRPHVAWREMLLKAQDHFADRLFDLEALPQVEQNRRSTELFALRRALQVITDGANSDEGESPLAEQYLRGKGVLPHWGERVLFAGRGGLRATKQRLDYIEGRLKEVESKLDHALLSAEAALARPEITVSRSTATV